MGTSIKELRDSTGLYVFMFILSIGTISIALGIILKLLNHFF